MEPQCQSLESHTGKMNGLKLGIPVERKPPVGWFISGSSFHFSFPSLADRKLTGAESTCFLLFFSGSGLRSGFCFGSVEPGLGVPGSGSAFLHFNRLMPLNPREMFECVSHWCGLV